MFWSLRTGSYIRQRAHPRALGLDFIFSALGIVLKTQYVVFFYLKNPYIVSKRVNADGQEPFSLSRRYALYGARSSQKKSGARLADTLDF